MKFEKFFNSRIFSFFERIYNLILLNILTIFFTILGLGIFTFMPAIVSLIIIIRSLKHDTDFPIFSTFFNAFKSNYRRVFLISLFYILLGIICLFNSAFFYTAMIDWQNIINIIIFYFSIIIDVIFLLSFINACFILVYFPNLNNKVIKYSFVLIKIGIVKELIILLMVIGLYYLFFIAPIMIIFIAISLFFYIVNLIIRNIYERLVADGVKSLDAFLYINKTK
jgi:uncharacterized membrane protein YesL